jgi:hypothetical protein
MKTLLSFLLLFMVSIGGLKAQPYWKNFTQNTGMPFNKAFVIEADNHHRIWYGTNSGFSSDTGLVYYENGQFYKANVANAGLIYGLKANKDTLWVVTGSKILSFNNYTTWQVHDPEPVIGFTPLGYSGPLVIDDYGNKWLRPNEGEDGLLRYNSGTWQRYKTDSSQIPTNKTHTIHWFDSALWLGTDTGLIQFKNNQWQIINTSNSDLPNDTVTVISDDRARLNLITKDNKISIMVSTGNFTSFSNPALRNASAMTVDGNSVMWIVVEQGIISLVGNQFTNYRSDNSGLVDNLTLSVTVDKNDHKWIGTFFGISVLKETPINLSVGNNSHNTLNVYPNPASSFLKLDGGVNGNYKIYNTIGQLVQQGIVANETILTHKLEKGVYMLLIENEKKMTFSTRFIKE